MNLYGDYLLRTTILLVKDEQLAEEIVQDTFITAYKKMNQLKEPEKLKSWLTTITLNNCRTHFRTWSWKNIFPSEKADYLQATQASPSAEQQFMNKIENGNIKQILEQLPYIYRETLTLYYFSELKISEIASLTKTSESAIKSRLQRGRLQLQNLLEKGEKHHG